MREICRYSLTSEEVSNAVDWLCSVETEKPARLPGLRDYSGKYKIIHYPAGIIIKPNLEDIWTNKAVLLFIL
ncbi:MAG: hypothetical protein IKH57_02945 [Clostridia bacterium]|nr:hypothetical protein [Clostridia bacterium]